MQLGAMTLKPPSRAVRLALFSAGCLLVAWLSLMPAEELPPGGLSDKSEHFIAYAALAMLGAWAFPARVLRVAAALAAFGVGVEILQATMGLGRQGDPVDALANTIGVAVGLALWRLLRRRPA